MREGVHTPKSGLLAGIAVAGIAVVYFLLLGSSDFSEPGANLEYNIAEFEALDKVETNYTELQAVPVDVPSPRALAVGKDTLFVAGENIIAVYGADDAPKTKVAIAGAPNCLGVAADGTLYAGLKDKVLVLDAAGAVRAEWGGFSARSYLTAIAARGDDVYVADAGERTVSRFDRDGKLLATIGKKDEANDVPGLEAPSPYLDLAINEEGHLWVVNPGRLGLERYEPGGGIVTSWYRPTVLKLEGFPGCCNPTHIAFTSKGELVTTEKGLVRVKTFDVTSGEFEGLVAGSSAFPREPSVRDLAVDARDRILVLDPQRNAVRVFARKENANAQAA